MSLQDISPDSIQISIIITSINESQLTTCLNALLPQVKERAHELIVVTSWQCSDISHRSNTAKLIPSVGVDGETHSQLRRRGLEAARGQLVCFLADDYLATPTWMGAIEEALYGSAAVTGGPVLQGASPGSINKAAYLCEYAALASPHPASRRVVPAGGNIAYRRETLNSLSDETRSQFSDWFWIRELQRQGIRIEMNPEMAVNYYSRINLWEFVLTKFRHSRQFSAMRARFEHGSFTIRLLRILACPVLPFLFLLRVFRAADGNSALAIDIAISAPLLLFFYLAGALGEAVGLICGPGQSK